MLTLNVPLSLQRFPIDLTQMPRQDVRLKQDVQQVVQYVVEQIVEPTVEQVVEQVLTSKDGSPGQGPEQTACGSGQDER